MPAALTPAQALGYLRELSADITAAIVLDADGELLAGPPALHAAARALLDHAPTTPQLHGRTDAGAVFAARDDRHQIVVATGPLALPRLTRHDLRTALAALGGGATPDTTPIEAPNRLVEPLLAAAGGRL